MKYAKSLRYGGDLVDALDCDYGSFKQLLPLCPECSEPVHLRKGGDRMSAKGKSHFISPHWAHFKCVSEEQKAGCESRVSKYTDGDRCRIAAQACGQRLRWLNNFFWKVWTSERLPTPDDLAMMTAAEERLPHATELRFDVMLDTFCNNEQPHIFRTLSQTLDMLAAGQPVGTVKGGEMYWLVGQSQKDFAERVKQGFDMSMHRKYCYEVVDFLRSAKAKPLLTALLAYALQCTLYSCGQGKPPDDVPASIVEMETFEDGRVELTVQPTEITVDIIDALFSDAVSMVLAQIAITPWADAFQRMMTDKTLA